MTDTARDKAWAEWQHGSPELFPEQYEAFNAGWAAATQANSAELAEARAALARVEALAERLSRLHRRVCKKTSERIPISKRSTHNCGVTGSELADDLYAALDGDGAK